MVCNEVFYDLQGGIPRDPIALFVYTLERERVTIKWYDNPKREKGVCSMVSNSARTMIFFGIFLRMFVGRKMDVFKSGSCL